MASNEEIKFSVERILNATRGNGRNATSGVLHSIDSILIRPTSGVRHSMDSILARPTSVHHSIDSILSNSTGTNPGRSHRFQPYPVPSSDVRRSTIQPQQPMQSNNTAMGMSDVSTRMFVSTTSTVKDEPVSATSAASDPPMASTSSVTGRIVEATVKDQYTPMMSTVKIEPESTMSNAGDKSKSLASTVTDEIAEATTSTMPDQSSSSPMESSSEDETPPASRFQCSKCGKSYSHQPSLSRHMQSHRGVKFVCQRCGEVFTRADSLKKHIANNCC